MDLSVVKRKQLNTYIVDGSIMALQKYFADATKGFENLVNIANGTPVITTETNKDGEEYEIKTVPSFRDQINSNKLRMDKGFPSLQASHVINQTVGAPVVEDVDVSGLIRELNQLTEQAKEMKRKEVG